MATRFGAYEIIYELKSGGMGAVLLGRRRGPGAFEQLVAIKTIRPEYANAAHVRAMFLDEAAILARLNHPAIASVHDFGEEAGTLYMVMEYVAGIPFRDLVDLRPPPGVAARAISEACRGVHAAHELRDHSGQLLGVVHRDISPDNLMLGFDGHVKVIDFGIALVKNRQSPVTEFGTVKGKPPYMSPEQVKNEGIDRRSDVFSLAVVLHELLTGKGLFDGDSIYAIARAVEHQAIDPPSRLAGTLPPGLDGAVMKALDRDVGRRTPTAAELAEQLEQTISAAGHETLESWAERELAHQRDEHRAWLSRVVTGTNPRVVGRASGSVTPLASTMPAADLASPAVQPSAEPTHLPAAVDDGALRKRRVLPIVLALLVLAGVGIGIVSMLNRSGTPSARDAAIVAVIDAAADAAIDAPPPAADAAVLLLVDATVARPDAAHRSTPDARTVSRDAAAPLDAAAVEPAGTGKLTVKHRSDGTFLIVMVDNKRFGVTPIFAKSLPAGTHTIELVAPDSDETVYKTTITIADGKTETVIQP